MHEQNNTDGPKCLECGKYTERIGSFSACANGYCDRYAIPVNGDGQTDEEARADAIAPLIPEEIEADDDATGCSEKGFAEYLRTHSSHTEFGYARND